MTATRLTQTGLATRIGRNQVWVHRYLHGEGDADLATLERIAQVFGRTLLEPPRRAE
jgi:transcriptional regulator with XRE-family HTH domain